MIAVIGKRGLDRIPADLRPAVIRAAQEASVFQRAHAAQKGTAATEELKRLGVSYQPMAKTEPASFPAVIPIAFAPASAPTA